MSEEKNQKSMNELLAETSAKALAARAKAVVREPAPEEESIEASDLWNALIAIPRPHRRIAFPRKIPGTDQPIGFVEMWPLTQNEQHAANAAADKFARDLMKDPVKKEEVNLGFHHAYTNDLAVQVIYRACRDAENLDRPAFPSPKLLREYLSTDEAGVLFSSYCTVQSELGPIRARMTQQEFEAMIIRIAEGGSSDPLDSISLELQRSLIVFTACRLVACWTDMSSHGLRPDASTFALEMLAELEKAKAAAIARGEEPELLPDVVAPPLAPEDEELLNPEPPKHEG